MKPEDFNIIGFECDVSSEGSVKKAYQQIMDTFGRIDSVVASAGTADSPMRLHSNSNHFTLGIVENYSAFE